MNVADISGLQSLDAMIVALEHLEKFQERLAPIFADEGKRMVAECIDTQSDPYGVPWEPSVTGRGPMLTNALAALTVSQSKRKGRALVFLKLSGVEAQHNFGQVKGGRKRMMLPKRSAPLPDKLRDRILQRMIAEFKGEVDAGGKAGA